MWRRRESDPCVQHIHLPGTSVPAEGLSEVWLLCGPSVWLDEEEEEENLAREREELL